MADPEPPTIEEFREWNTARLCRYLRERLPLTLLEKDLDILRNGEYSGRSLLASKYAESLAKAGMAAGRVLAISYEIEHLKSGTCVSPRSIAPPSPPPAKKQRHNHSPLRAYFAPYEDLFHRISKECLQTAADYSDPAKLLTLPFPYLGDCPVERFRLNGEGSFQYLGREMFGKVLDEIESLKWGHGYRSIYIYGTMGYGKSHILAAMACFLLRKKQRVVYLPDCRALVADFVSYTRPALLLAYWDDLESLYEIERCKTMDDLVKFCCKPIPPNSIAIRLYFIIDQYNALDPEPLCKDDIPNEEKDRVRMALKKMAHHHYSIRSASANLKSALFMGQKQTNEKKVAMYGGLSEAEMIQWWTIFKPRLPELQAADMHRIEDLTGRIPLMLRPLLNPEHHGKPFPEVEAEFQHAPEIQNVIQFANSFAIAKRDEWKIKEMHSSKWRSYLDAMSSCLLQTTAPMNSAQLFDHRFFYADDDGIGNSTCGLARNVMVGFLRTTGIDFFSSQQWLNRMVDFRNNPSVLGFIIEQACLSSISQKGLNFAGLGLGFQKLKIAVFNGPFPKFTVPEGSAEVPERQLYLPLAFNHNAIDGVVVSVDKVNKTVDLIPIQITIAQRHSDSEIAFFSHWETWSSFYTIHGYKVTSKFLWITAGDGSSMQITEVEPRTVKSVRNRSIEFPPYRRIHARLEDIDTEIADHYAQALAAK